MPDPTPKRPSHGDFAANGRSVLSSVTEGISPIAGKPPGPLSDSTIGPVNRPIHEHGKVRTAGLGGLALPLEFGDYRLIRKIGEGGMGIVFEAEQKSLGNRRLAIKTIKYFGDLDDRAVKRFQAEVQAVAQLEHRHIVPVYELGEESGVHYYSMKFIEGKNLRDLVKALRTAVSRGRHNTARSADTEKAVVEREDLTHSSGWSRGDTLASNELLGKVSQQGSTGHPQFVKNFVRMGIQVATALHHVHQQGIVHRDIKPGNLLLDVDGDIWLTDFGLALIRDTPSLTAPGDLVGTYHYMSPEQAMGSRRVIVDHRSDIYSLGVTLYELLTLTRAFPGSSREEVLRSVQFGNPPPITKIAPSVPKDLETIVGKAMAKDPSARFQSAAEMAAELQRFQDGKPLTIRPQSILEKFGYWAKNNRHTAISLAAVSAVVFFASIIVAAVAVKAQADTQRALESEQTQKREVTRQLNRAEGLRLAANSALQVEQDPSLALLLAVNAANNYPGADAHDAILRAMDLGREARVLNGHSVPVGHVAFNHDGSRLISSAKAETAQKVSEPAIIWETRTGVRLGELRGQKTITSAVFSPDKARILTVSSPAGSQATNNIDGTLPAGSPTLWDGTSFTPLKSFENAFLFTAHRHAFSPKGERIVFPVQGNKAQIFDCVAGTPMTEFVGHESRVTFAAFNPTRDEVVTLSDDHTVRIWDAASGQERLKLDHWQNSGALDATGDVKWVEFTADGRKLVTGSENGGIELWDLENEGRAVHAERLPGTHGALYANGDLLATYGIAESPLAIRSLHDTRWIEDQSTNNLIRQAAISADSKHVAMLDFADMRKLALWDLERREMLATLPGQAVIHDLAISPDSKYVATAGDDATVQLWHISDGRDRATFGSTTHKDRPIFSTSPDGRTFSVATIDPDRVSSLCDFDQSKAAWVLDGAVALPGSGGKRFLAGNQGRLAIHSLDDGRFLNLETNFHRDVMAMAINRDGDSVAVFIGGDDVVLWSPDENRRRSIPVGNAAVNKLRFDQSGSKLFILSEDGTIRVADAKSGDVIKRIQQGGRLVDLDFNADGTRFATVALPGQASLYDAQTYDVVRPLTQSTTNFDRIKFSSDGKRLLAYTEFDSKSITLYDVESGAIQATLEVLGNLDVALHPNQPEALLCSDQAGAFIWRYEENVRLPVTAQRTSSGAYSIDGNHFYLATWTPAVYQATSLDNLPEDMEASKVTRWVRDGLLQDKSIDFTPEAVRRIVVSDQGQVISSALRWNRIVNYSSDSHQPVSIIAGHDGRVSSCLYLSNSKRLITTSWDGSVSIWDVADGSLKSRRYDHGAPITSAAVSRDDQYLVTGARDGTLMVWNLADGATAGPFSVASSPILHLSLNADAGQVLALSADHQAIRVNRETGEPMPLDLHAEKIEWAEFSPDGSSLLVVPFGEPSQAADANADSTESQTPTNIVLIVPVDGTAITRLEYPQPVSTSHFHPDSERIVTTTRTPDAATVWIQIARSRQTEQRFDYEDGDVFGAVFDPAGEFVYVQEFNAGSIWRVSDGRKWLTVEDASVDHPWRHTVDPFAAGPLKRLFVRRFDTAEYRDLPLDPGKEASGNLPRPLSKAERKRFLIQD